MKYLDTSATVSDCGKFRYDLRRVWDYAKPRVLFIAYNPSTADGTLDDPTIRRVVNFAVGFDAGSVVMCNLFAFRATWPKVLRRAADPVGPENDLYIQRHAVECDYVVAAWGSLAETGKRPILQARPPHVLRLLDQIGAKVFHLGLTQGGQPRHPLFLRNEATLTRWERTEAVHG